MKQKRIIAFALALLMCALTGASALAATQSGTDIWVGYNAKYTFYLLDKESGDSLVRIDAANKTKTLYTRKAGIWNIIYCDNQYVYVTGETESKNFKKLSRDAAHEDSMYGVIHIDIIRIDVETGKAKTLKTNLPEQIPSGDANYLYYTPDDKNQYRMKHDGTGAKKYATLGGESDSGDTETFSNGNTATFAWQKDTTTITRKDGTKKTISGIPYAMGSYLFVWQHRSADDEGNYSLYRYDLNGEKRTAITSMQNRDKVDFTYHNGALYFIENVIEDYELVGYRLCKLTTGGKLTTLVDRSKQKDSPHGLCIVIAGNWLFIYNDPEDNAMWGQYISKHKISTK